MSIKLVIFTKTRSSKPSSRTNPQRPLPQADLHNHISQDPYSKSVFKTRTGISMKFALTLLSTFCCVSALAQSMSNMQSIGTFSSDRTEVAIAQFQRLVGTRTPTGALKKANGFKNCRRQNNVLSTAFKPASSHVACHSFSITLT